MYSVQMVLEQARATARAACEAQQQIQVFLAAYAQLLDAQPAIERLQQSIADGFRQTSSKTTAA